MYKDIIITIIIIIIVLSGDLMTHKYTEECTKEIDNNLSDLKEEVSKRENYEKIISKILYIEDRWDKMQEKLTYYLEHDELEKVTAQLSEIRGYIEANEIEESIPRIENCKFLLEHIKDKQLLNLKNIF